MCRRAEVARCGGERPWRSAAALALTSGGRFGAGERRWRAEVASGGGDRRWQSAVGIGGGGDEGCERLRLGRREADEVNTFTISVG